MLQGPGAVGLTLRLAPGDILLDRTVVVVETSGILDCLVQRFNYAVTAGYVQRLQLWNRHNTDHIERILTAAVAVRMIAVPRLVRVELRGGGGRRMGRGGLSPLQTAFTTTFNFEFYNKFHLVLGQLKMAQGWEPRQKGQVGR